MIHLDYLLVIGILLSVLLFLLVGVFYYSKSNLLKGLNIWILIILSALLSYLLYPLYELTDYREEFTSIVIIAAIIIKIIINLSIIAIISILLLNLNFLVYKDYEFVSRFGGAWGFFVLLIMCTGFFQKRDSLYYKRGIIAIVSILFGVVGSAYAFKDIFFK